MILYALGYIFRPGVESGMVKTGLISLATEPPGATVFLGSKRFSKKTPAVIRGLVPGDYPVSVQMKGYRGWASTVPVEDEKATVLEKILLFPEKMPSERLLDETFSNIVPIEKGDFFILIGGRQAGKAYLFDWRDSTARPLFGRDSAFAEARLRAVRTSKGRNVLLEIADEGEKKRLLWTEPKREETGVSDVTKLIPPEAAPEWNDEVKNTVFFEEGHSLTRVNLQNQAVYPKFLEGVAGFGLVEKKLFVLTDAGELERVDSGGQREEPLAEPLTLGSLLKRTEFYRIEAFSRGRLLFLSKKGHLLASVYPHEMADAGVRGIRMNDNGDLALVWGEHDLVLLDWPTERPRLSTVTEGAGRIEQVFWAHEDSHAIYRDGSRVRIAETHFAGRRQSRDLVDVKPGTDVAYVEQAGKLFYLDESGRLNACQIVPKPLRLPFGEPARKEKD